MLFSRSLSKLAFMYLFETSQNVKASLEDVFDFFSRAENLQKLTPPFLNFQILTPLPIKMAPGQLIDYKIKIHGIPVTWRTKITEWQPLEHFVDNQIKGPFKLWNHTHKFTSLGAHETLMEDTVKYILPFGILGRLAEPFFVKPDIKKIFEYRRVVIEDFFRKK